MSDLVTTAGVAPSVTIANVGSTEHYHYTGLRKCRRVVGPRGGVRVEVVEVRASGRVQTWETRPRAFRRPVKYGLYEASAITERNGRNFHRAEDCPF